MVKLQDGAAVGLGQAPAAAPAAFTHEYENYIAAIMAVVPGATQEQAEDIGQEAFLRAAESGSMPGTDEECFRLFRRIATNLGIDGWRRADRAERALENLAAMAEAAYADASRGDPAELVAYQQLVDHMLHAVAGLTPKLREAVSLRYFEGLSYADIGKRLKIREGTARQRVSDGVSRIAKELRRNDVHPVVFMLAARTRHALRGAESAAPAAAPAVSAVVVATVAAGLAALTGPAGHAPGHSLDARFSDRLPAVSLRDPDRAAARPEPVRDPGRKVATPRATQRATPDPDAARTGRRLPVPVLHDCDPVCLGTGEGDRDMAGDVMRVDPIGYELGQTVTPTCWLTPANPAVSCRRGQDPEAWTVNELPPVFLDPGGTP